MTVRRRRILSLVLVPLLLSVPAAAEGPILADGIVHLASPADLADLTVMHSGANLNIGLRSDGHAVAFGLDTEGLTGGIDPTAVYQDLALAPSHLLLLRDDGSIDAVAGASFWYPIEPPEPNAGFVAVAANGFFHSLALRDDGSVVAWGAPVASVTDLPVPNSGFKAIASGHHTNYALREDGSIAVWGSNSRGQFDVPAPNSGFMAVTAGDGFALALREDGSLAAWGSNVFGALDIPSPNSGFEAVVAGDLHVVALREDGSVESWGHAVGSQAASPLPASGFELIAAGGYHSVGRLDDGRLVGWGQCDDGVCGVQSSNMDFVRAGQRFGIRADGSLWLHDLGMVPPNVPDPNSGFLAVEENRVVVALRGDGSLVGWGDDYYGALNFPEPNSGFTAIEAGGEHFVALREGGTLAAWGRNNAGQCTIPDPGPGYVDIAAGVQHSIALHQDGSILVWGGGMPGPPAPNSGFIDVASGPDHLMALRADGSIVVWGTVAWSPHLAIPEPNEGYVAIDAAIEISLAQREDGTVVGWGGDFLHGRTLFDGRTDLSAVRADFFSAYAVVEETTTAVAPAPATIRGEVELGARPNPFNPKITVWFRSPVSTGARVEVYDVRGRRVRSLWQGRLEGDVRQSVSWDGRDHDRMHVASGTYYLRLITDSGVSASRAVTLLK